MLWYPTLVSSGILKFSALDKQQAPGLQWVLAARRKAQVTARHTTDTYDDNDKCHKEVEQGRGRAWVGAT